MAIWYQIDGIFYGTLDESRAAGSDEECDEIVEEIKKLYEAEGPEWDWAIYVVPHYCDPGDEECTCVQYLTDHHPVYARF